MNNDPYHAIAAVQHADPYPYYARLRQGAALQFDPELKLWLASRADVIRQLLTHPAAKVRPATAPVPPHLAATSISEVFALLIRMTDGNTQQQHKAWLQQRLSALTTSEVQQLTLQSAQQLQTTLADKYQRTAGHLFSPGTMPDAEPAPATVLNEFIRLLPVTVVARLLNFSPDQAALAAIAIADFIRAVLPDADPATIKAGDHACATLLAQLRQTTTGADWQLANLLGLLMQSYEATSGLIGNSLIALLRQQLMPTTQTNPEFCLLLVHEVARFDPPVQNTRRFISADCEIAGIQLPEGSTVLLLLAAAGRDEQQYQNAGQFRLDRATTENLAFSCGAHRCPGEWIACQIAAVAIEHLLKQQLPPMHWRYQNSANARLPVFFHSQQQGVTL